MTNTKTTKRSLFSSVVALLLCFSMLLGTTYAWFTDTAASNGNKIVAGELDVELQMYDGSNYINIGDSKQPIFGVNSIAEQQIAQNNNADTLWEPGKTQVAYLAIKNDGNLDLKYTVALRVFGVKNDLYKVMKYAIIPDAHPNTAPVNAWDATKGKSVVEGTQTVSDGDVFLANRQTHYFALVIHMDENATNEYQNGEINFDLTVLATQVSSESDSFGNTYDENATYPTIIQVTKPVEADAYGTSKEEVTFSQVAEDSAISKVEVTVPAGAKLENDAEELVLTVTEAKDANPDIVIYASEQATTYNINIKGIDSDEVSGNTEPIEITLYIEKGLSGVKLYHHDELITSTYNATTGALSFSTATFSPFTVVHEKVGGSADVDDSTIYVDSAAKLVAAFNAAKDGDTIILTNDVIFDETTGYISGTYVDGIRYVGDKSFTIDLNGKTITDNGVVNDYLLYLNNKGEKANEITIKNGALVSKSGCWSTVCVNSSASTQETVLNLEGVNIVNSCRDESYDSNTTVRARNKATVNVNNGTVITSDRVSYGVTASASDAIVNINNGATVIQKNSGITGGNSVYTAVSGTGVVNINDGAIITSDRYGVHTMTTGKPVVNVKGGTITADIALKASTNGGEGELATINVTGGIINGKLETYTNNGHIYVSGGTFTVDPSNYVSTGYKAICEDGVYSIIEDKSAALTAAINAGETTITLDAGYYTLPNVQNKNIVLIGAGPETIVDYSHMGNYQEVSGSSFVFKNMTIQCAEKGYPYPGLQHTTSVSYENCQILGTANLFSPTTFKNCTFNSGKAEHNVVTYGSDSVTFENCEFTYADRAVNCYAENASARDVEITFTDCSFTKVEGKEVTGAIETNSSLMNSLTVTISNCTVNKGDLWWVAKWDSLNGANTRVCVNGAYTLSLAGFLSALEDADYNYDGEGVTVILKDSEYNHYNNTVRQFYVPASTVNINSDVETITIKNVVFTFEDDDLTNAYVTGELQTLAKNVTFEGCTFDNVSVSPWETKTGANDCASATFTDCTWNNLTGRYGVHQSKAATLTVTGCTFNSQRGIHVNTVDKLTVTNNTFKGIGDGSGVLCLSEGITVEPTTINVSGNVAEGQTMLRQLSQAVTYDQVSAIFENNTYGAGKEYVEGSIVVTETN